VRAFFDIDAAREAAGLPRSDSAAYANVELVRRVVAAGYRRPRPDFATLNALVHPEHEQIPFASRVEGGRLEGARGFREWLDSFENTFGSWTARTEDVRAIDGERVLVTGVFNAVGKRSGVPIEQHFALVMTVRDGKVRPTETFSSPEEALQTAARRD
jgi:ketosteroid isomerase-like protein